MKNFARIYLDTPDRSATVTVTLADGRDLSFTVSGDGSLTLYDDHGGHWVTYHPYDEER